MATKSVIFGDGGKSVDLLPVSLTRLRMSPWTWVVQNDPLINIHRELVVAKISTVNPTSGYLDWAEIANSSVKQEKLPIVDPEIFISFCMLGLAAAAVENSMRVAGDQTLVVTHALLTVLAMSDDTITEWMKGLSLEMGYQSAKRSVDISTLAMQLGLST